MMVDREGGMRFFAGVPLVGSSGHRLGMWHHHYVLNIIGRSSSMHSINTLTCLMSITAGRQYC